MQIADSKTREQFPLSKKKIIKKTLVGVIMYLLLLPFLCFFVGMPVITIGMIIGLGSGLALALLTLLVFLVLLAVGGWLIYWYQRKYFEVYFYDFTADFIQIRKGVITPREITIPYERVQDVYVDQDVLDRMFGLYDVHLSSATAASGMEAHIDGLEQQAAEGLRTTLLDTVRQRISRRQAPTVGIATVTASPPQAAEIPAN